MVVLDLLAVSVDDHQPGINAVPEWLLGHQPPGRFVVEQRLVGRHWGPWRTLSGRRLTTIVWLGGGQNSGKLRACPTVHCQRTIIFLAADWSAKFSSAYVRLEIRQLAVDN
jgi:hypothetical protein